MSIQNRLVRLLTGICAVIFTLGVMFAILLPMAHRWGATTEEVNTHLPGDELLDQPLVNWTNATTIQAPPEKVWPWIIQIGERRGGYYSYTFIENALAGTGSYQNANRILPEFQNPSPGEIIINGALQIREVQPGQYMLAESTSKEMGWTWVWHISPVENGQTRLVIRNHVQPFTGDTNPVMGFFMDVGGFAMEQRMMQGIKLRAEGFSEPAYLETLEFVLWLGTLTIGLAAGFVFLLKAAWQKSLLVGIASVVMLPVLLMVQPPMWMRMVIVLGLAIGLVWSILSDRQFVRSERRTLSQASAPNG